MSDAWAIEASTRNLARLDGELRGYLRKIGRPDDEIASVVARTWVAAGRTFEGRCSLRFFLFSVMRRLLCDYHRRAKNRPWFYPATDDEVTAEPDDLTTSGVSLDSTIDQCTMAERVREALGQMPSHYAQVVELKLQGHDNFAIADMLGIDYDTVRSRYSRGKARLLEALSAYEA